MIFTLFFKEKTREIQFTSKDDPHFFFSLFQTYGKKIERMKVQWPFTTSLPYHTMNQYSKIWIKKTSYTLFSLQFLCMSRTQCNFVLKKKKIVTKLLVGFSISFWEKILFKRNRRQNIPVTDLYSFRRKDFI